MKAKINLAIKITAYCQSCLKNSRVITGFDEQYKCECGALVDTPSAAKLKMQFFTALKDVPEYS